MSSIYLGTCIWFNDNLKKKKKRPTMLILILNFCRIKNNTDTD